MAPRPLKSLASDTSSMTLQSADLLHGSPPPESELPPRPVPVPSANEPNPWLAPREATSKAPRKKNEIVVGKDSATLDKSKNKLTKQMKKLTEEKEKARDDAIVEISADGVMLLDHPSVSGTTVNPKFVKGKGKAVSSKATAEVPADESDANSEIEEQEKALNRKGKSKSRGVKAFEQRDLVARAFAGDNVVQVWFALAFTLFILTFSSRRSKMLSDERQQRMLLVLSIPRFLVGYVLLRKSLSVMYQSPFLPIGFVGRIRHTSTTTQTPSHQESCRN